jgi:hypothetical protein
LKSIGSGDSIYLARILESVEKSYQHQQIVLKNYTSRLFE